MKPMYAECATWEGGRQTLVRDVVDWWRSLDPPGRFLTFNRRHGCWLDVGDANAEGRTAEFMCELLREKQEDAGPMLSALRGVYDEAVLDVALYNYECFHHLGRGTASFAEVVATSAGVEGWASCVIQDEKEGTPPAKSVASQQEKDPGKASCERTPPKRKCDMEEDRQLQIALLESVGARPCRIEQKSFDGSYDDSRNKDDDSKTDELSDYEFEYDDVEDEDEEEQDEELKDEEEVACSPKAAPMNDVISCKLKTDLFRKDLHSVSDPPTDSVKASAETTGTMHTPLVPAESPRASDSEEWSQVGSATGDDLALC